MGRWLLCDGFFSLGEKHFYWFLLARALDADYELCGLDWCKRLSASALGERGEVLRVKVLQVVLRWLCLRLLSLVAVAGDGSPVEEHRTGDRNVFHVNKFY